MDHKKIISEFKKQIDKAKKEGVSQEEVDQYFDLMKVDIKHEW